MSTSRDLPVTDILQQHYEFKKLDRFIQEEISQVISVNYPISDKLLSDSKIAIAEEVERIKQRMIDAKIQFKTALLLETYVQGHQRSLIQMTGALLQYAQAEHIVELTETQGAEIFCQYLYRALQNLMSFIENQFPRHFDQNAWIPTTYRRILIHSFRSKLPHIQKNLAQHNIDSTLIKIVLQPVTAFITTEDDTSVTYQKVIYLKELIDHLTVFAPIHPTTDRHETLHELLLSISFNSVEYFNYRIRAIKANVSVYAPITEQIETLWNEARKIRQHVFTTGLTLNNKYPFLQDQLLEWINSETDVLIKTHNLYKTTEPVAFDTSADKFPLDMSMDKLAVWARLLHDHAKANNSKSIKATKLFKFIASTFQTVQAPNMSEKNLSNLFYSPDPGAIAAVIEDLNDLKKIGMALKGKK